MFNNTSGPLAKVGKIAAVSAITLGSLATTSAATADTGTFADARGDLAHGADIHSVKLVNEKNVRIKVQHRDLVRDFRSGSSLKIYIDTDRSERGPEYVFVGATHGGSDYALVEAENWKQVNRADGPLRGSYEMNLHYAKDIAHVRIGRAILGHPDEVRVTVKTGGELADGTNGVDWLHGVRKFTPWIAHG